MNLQGIEVHTLTRKGKCQCCKKELLNGTNSVIVGSFSNKYRYCIDCFNSWCKENIDE